VLKYISLSTWFHDGNHAEHARLLGRPPGSPEWVEILPKTALQGHSLLKLALPTHSPACQDFRIEMFPDGGLSRLGLYAELPDWAKSEFQPLATARSTRRENPIPQPSKPLTIPFSRRTPRASSSSEVRDWASLAQGGRVVRVSNQHYGPADQVISPYPALHMFDGFESARSRTPGHHEELELELGHPILVECIEMDFTHFVNNNPRAVRILGQHGGEWEELVGLTDVKAFAANVKEFHLRPSKKTQLLKFEIFPDGGINRIRVYGHE
jgi:allantoicase